MDSMKKSNKRPSEAVKSLYKAPLPSARTGPLYNAFSYPTKISPEAIAVFIATHTNPGATVLDAFGGSGTTGLAAMLCDRPTEAMHKMAKDMGVTPVGPEMRTCSRSESSARSSQRRCALRRTLTSSQRRLMSYVGRPRKRLVGSTPQWTHWEMKEFSDMQSGRTFSFAQAVAKRPPIGKQRSGKIHCRCQSRSPAPAARIPTVSMRANEL